MVVFGGFDVDGSFPNDVWALTLAGNPAWSQLLPQGMPPIGRYGHTAVYDPVRDRMVVFGGHDFTFFPFGDVWALALAGSPAWSRLLPGAPPPGGRAEHTAVYDPVRDRMVVFGGFDIDGSLPNDVWALTLAGSPAWSQLLPEGSAPSGRYAPTALYDPVRDRMVVFGGYDDTFSFPSDVWALALAGSPAWSQLLPGGPLPGGRAEHTAVYDAVRDRMVVFGGDDGSLRNDVWALMLAGNPAWSQLLPEGTRPSGRYAHTATFDPVRDRMVVFGGQDFNFFPFNDVWALTLAGNPAWNQLLPEVLPEAFSRQLAVRVDTLGPFAYREAFGRQLAVRADTLGPFAYREAFGRQLAVRVDTLGPFAYREAFSRQLAVLVDTMSIPIGKEAISRFVAIRVDTVGPFVHQEAFGRQVAVLVDTSVAQVGKEANSRTVAVRVDTVGPFAHREAFGRQLAVLAIDSASTTPLDSGLVAHYPLDGNALDVSPNHNHGTLRGDPGTPGDGPVPGPDRSGNPSGACFFDGVNDFIQAIADSLPTRERTVALWFRSDGAQRPTLLGYGGISCGESWFMNIFDGILEMSSHCGVNHISYTPPEAPVGRWIHWAITTDSAGTRVYIEGLLVQTNDNFVTNTYVEGRDLAIGVNVSPGGFAPYTDPNVGYFGGLLDDVRIYDRALGPTDIWLLATGSGDMSGPVITIQLGPGEGGCASEDSTTFAWSGNDNLTPVGELVYAYRLDGDSLSAFGPATAVTLTGLALGPHTFEIRGRDGSGNVSSLVRHFTVDLSAPTVSTPTARVIDGNRVRFITIGGDDIGVTGFHFQVDDDTTFADSLSAEADVGPNGEYVFAGQHGHTYYARALALDCAGRSSPYSRASNGGTIADLPDLVVDSVGAPPTAATGLPIQVSWTVRNLGLGGTNVPQWSDDVVLSRTRSFNPATAIFLGRFPNLTYLDAGESYRNTQTVTLPYLPPGEGGKYFVIVLTDTLDQLPELSGSNNTGVSDSLQITLSDVADLQVEQVAPDPNPIAGDTIDVGWTVRNAGEGRTDVDHWYDTVFLSSDTTFSIEVGVNTLRVLDLPLGTRFHVGALEPRDSANSTVQESLSVVLPDTVSGTRYVFVVSDMRATSQGEFVSQVGDVFENGADLNRSAPHAVEIEARARANLLIEEFIAVDGDSSGGPVTVTYRVRNGGLNSTFVESWSDRLYLSTDPTFGSDELLGAFVREGRVLLDSSYTAQITGTLPAGASGSRWLFLQVDAEGHVNEEKSDNLATLALEVELSPWPNLQVVSGAVPAAAQAKDLVPISWDIRNNGNATTSARPWIDEVWISRVDPWHPTTARRLTGAQGASPLPVGESYAHSALVEIPLPDTGLQFVYIVTDAQDSEFEHTDDDDNVTRIGSITVRPYPTVDLALSNLSAPPAAASGQSMDVTWTVTNLGNSTTLANAWVEQIFLSSDTAFGNDIALPSVTHAGALEAQGSRTRTASVTIPNGLQGDYYVLVRTDPGGTSGDVNPANNHGAAAAPTSIALTPAPDLIVSALSSPDAGTAGQPLDIRWTVENRGAGATVPGAWTTGCYLSEDPFLDAFDMFLGSTSRAAPLAPTSSYAETLRVTLPTFASGFYYLIARVDSREEVYEANAESNNDTLRVLGVALAPPADLVVSDVTVPPQAEPGDSITVTFTLRNIGPHPANGLIHNAVYVSSDQTFQVEDPLIGIEPATVDLPPGASITLSRRLSLERPRMADLSGNLLGILPSLAAGEYHGIVRANVLNNIRELPADNNAGSSADRMRISMREISFGVPQRDHYGAGESRYFRIAAPAGKDLSVRLRTPERDATNQLLIAFGRVPSPEDFDHSGPPTFTAEPEVLVPTTQAGDYYVRVTALALPFGMTTEPITVNTRLLSHSLTGITPAAGGSPGFVTTTLTGAGLRDSTRVFLKQGVPPVEAEVEFINSTVLEARWDLRNVPEGVYHVEARTGDSVAVMAGAFKVEPARPFQLETLRLTPDLIRDNSTGNFTFRYRNAGNTDLPVVRVRLLFLASAKLAAIGKDPGLRARSDLMPELYAPVEGDAFVVEGPDRVPVEVVDLVGADVAPGEELSCTLGLRDFDASPFSVRSLSETMTPQAFLSRELGRIELARLAILADPMRYDAQAVALAGDAAAFRDSAVQRMLVANRLLSALEVEEYAVAPGGLVEGPSDAPEGPPELIADLAAGGPCATPREIPICRPDDAPLVSSLPACISCVEDTLPVGLRLPGAVEVPLVVKTCSEYSATLSADARVVAPCDPNVITGPPGYGTQKWVAVGQTLLYRVDFENLAQVAQAAAREVRVRVPLDLDFDVNSARLGNLGFGSHTIPLSNIAQIHLEPFFSDLGLEVHITASINDVTREATWTFTSIDPNTNQPPTDPNRGFLPVNDQTGRGQGYVTFTIRPKPALATGTEVAAQAFIKFDSNDPLATGLTLNRIDAASPTSQVQPGFLQLDSTLVKVQWNGADDSSGVASYALYMRQDSGAYTLQGQGLSTNSLLLRLLRGHLYGFYTVARDNSGNVEPSPSQPDASYEPGKTGVAQQVPTAFALYQSAPNPTRHHALVRFDLPVAAEVWLEVFDVAGRRVMVPSAGERFVAGRHALVVRGDRMPSGLYFYRFKAARFEATRRMLVLR